MNKSDSERISIFLESLGYVKINKPENADLIILNSCSVRQSAEDRIFGKINNFAKLKKENPNLILAITGCMPGRDTEKKFKKKEQLLAKNMEVINKTFEMADSVDLTTDDLIVQFDV